MYQQYLQICFISVVFVIIEVNCGIVHENGTTEKEILSDFLPGLKCESTICSCADFFKLGNVSCQSSVRNDISKLEFYDSNTDLYLNEKIFLGLKIHYLFLNNTNVRVAEKFLEGIMDLFVFNVEQSGIENIPDFRMVSNSIKEIRIQSSRLTSLDGQNMRNLSSLKHLSFYRNFIQLIASDVFKGTENLVSIDLTHNRLTFIPSTLLDPMKNLKVFNASHNNLLHVDNVFSITLPNYIKLDFNNITNVDSVLHFNFKEDGHLFPITNYHFSVCKVQLLDLRYNSIKELPKSLFSCYNTKNNGTCTYRIGNLELAGNELQSLNNSFQYSEIRVLNMSRNHLQYLTEEYFHLAHKVEKLYLQENQIRRINKHAFKTIRKSIVRLDLSSNNIKFLNESVRKMPELIILNLSFNEIQSFADDEFTGLRTLRYLFLERNRIMSLGPLQQLPVLQKLNIQNNNIKLLRINNVPKALKYMMFSGNPFNCDCNLQKFIRWLKENPLIITDTNLCLLPEENISQKLKKCPDMCSCRCTDIDDDHLMFVDCSSRNLRVVPEFFRNDLQRMEDKAYLFLHIEDHVSGFSLKNNKIESLDEFQLPVNLTHLNLANNKLKRLPEDMFDNQMNLKNVSLSGNPWTCDCKSLKFKKWLASKNNIIRDIEKVRCGSNDNGETKLTGRNIWTLSDQELCPTADLEFTFAVSFGIITFVIFCFAASIFYTKYELNIKVFLYHRGLTFVKKDDIDNDKYFDAFISFCHKDDEYVIKDIISVIEKEIPNIRLCLHYRHFIAGELIQNNITQAVQNSKRTVLILSRNFLKSEWCLLEFRTAHFQAMKDKVHRVIIVKFGNLPKDIDPDIKVYLDSTTYLTWGESNFWEKFLFVLPSRTSPRNSVPRNIRNDEVF